MIPRLSLLLPFLLGIVACDHSDPTRGSLGGGAPQDGIGGYGEAWIGVYAGTGSGIAGTENVEYRNASMTIAPDRGSAQLPSCPACVTITLDTLFSAMNVDFTDPQSVVVRQSLEGLRQALAMSRFSGGGGTANVVQARLTVDSIGGPSSIIDVTYLFELR